MGALIGRAAPPGVWLGWQLGGLAACRRRYPQATIARSARVCRHSRLAELAWIRPGASLHRCRIGRASRIIGQCRDMICGSFCAIARDCAIGVPPPGLGYEDRLPVTRLGHDVWIAQRATVQAGVHIATGAIIATGAVVTDDVPAYALVTGVPATVRRFRFDPELRAALLASSWWEWPVEQLRVIAAHFDAEQPLEASRWQAILAEIGA